MTQISWGFWIGLVVCTIIAAGGLAWMAFADKGERGKGALWVAGAALVAVVIVWPFDMAYHQYRYMAGTVVSSTPRNIADGDGGTTQAYAVLFDDGTVRRCDDTRCAVLVKGDTLGLWCKREWQWASTPGYACRYADYKHPAPPTPAPTVTVPAPSTSPAGK